MTGPCWNSSRDCRGHPRECSSPVDCRTRNRRRSCRLLGRACRVRFACRPRLCPRGRLYTVGTMSSLRLSRNVWGCFVNLELGGRRVESMKTGIMGAQAKAFLPWKKHKQTVGSRSSPTQQTPSKSSICAPSRIYNTSVHYRTNRRMTPSAKARRAGVRWAPGPVCCTASFLVCLELKSNSYDYRAQMPSIP